MRQCLQLQVHMEREPTFNHIYDPHLKSPLFPPFHIQIQIQMTVTTQAYRQYILFSFDAFIKEMFPTLIRNVSFPSITDVGSHNLSPWRPNVLNGTPLGGLSLMGFLQSFKTRPLERDFYIITRNVSFSSRTRAFRVRSNGV